MIAKERTFETDYLDDVGELQMQQSELFGPIGAAATSGREELADLELCHRVSNHLQILLSIVEAGPAPGSHPTCDRLRSNLNALCDLYRLLGHRPKTKVLRVREYMISVCGNLVRGLLEERRIMLNVRIEEALLPMEICRKLAIVINELVLNAAKHAFPEECIAQVSICFKTTGAGEWALLVADNGRGAQQLQRPGSKGIGLIGSLVAEMGGRLRIRSNRRGTTFAIWLPFHGDRPA